jgi:hypothetical protein
MNTLKMAMVWVTCFATYASGQVEPLRLIPPHIAQFEMVLGRLQLSPEYFRIGTFHDRSLSTEGRERVRTTTVAFSKGQASLQYSDANGPDPVRLRFAANREVSIDLTSRNDDCTYRLIYQQPSEGDLFIRVEFFDGHPAKEMTVRSLWHLVVVDRVFYKTYLEFPLRALEPTWDLCRTIDEVQKYTADRRVTSHGTVDFEAAIENLDAPKTQERTCAYRQLQGCGLSVESLLRQRLATPLSPNQRQSVHHLLASIQPRGADDSVRVALWLAGDSQLLASHSTNSARHVAKSSR